MKYNWLLCCLVISLYLSAQRATFIVGKWKYKDVADKEMLDSATRKQADLVFQHTEMEFASGGKYRYNSISGTWSLNGDESKLSVILVNPASPNEKRTSEWKIEGLTATELKLNMGRAIMIMGKVPAAPGATSKTPKQMPGPDPFEIVKFVRKNAATDLLTYAEKFGNTYTVSLKETLTEYQSSTNFTYGIEYFSDSKRDGITVKFKFRDKEEKVMYMNKLKEEGFVTKTLSSASGTLVKDGVAIRMTTGDTWIISREAP